MEEFKLYSNADLYRSMILSYQIGERERANTIAAFLLSGDGDCLSVNMLNDVCHVLNQTK